MIMQYSLDKNNNILTFNSHEEYLNWHKENQDITRTIKKTTFENEILISTVFLSMNHNYDGGPPILFETMIFDDDEIGDRDGEQYRYTTYDEALNDHNRIVKQFSYKIV